MTESLDLNELKNTDCFTYTVTMLVQVIAPNEELARERLDREGGYVSERNVELQSSIRLHTHSEDIKEDSI
jgi:hypothetical protein